MAQLDAIINYIHEELSLYSRARRSIDLPCGPEKMAFPMSRKAQRCWRPLRGHLALLLSFFSLSLPCTSLPACFTVQKDADLCGLRRFFCAAREMGASRGSFSPNVFLRLPLGEATAHESRSRPPPLATNEMTWLLYF